MTGILESRNTCNRHMLAWCIEPRIGSLQGICQTHPTPKSVMYHPIVVNILGNGNSWSCLQASHCTKWHVMMLCINFVALQCTHSLQMGKSTSSCAEACCHALFCQGKKGNGSHHLCTLWWVLMNGCAEHTKPLLLAQCMIYNSLQAYSPEIASWCFQCCHLCGPLVAPEAASPWLAQDSPGTAQSLVQFQSAAASRTTHEDMY